MDASEIKDEKTLERWLEARPREDAICIAQRAALRVFPLWQRALEEVWAREDELTALPVLRCLVASGVAHGNSTIEVKKAILAAAAVARNVAFVAFSRTSAAFSAARAASDTAAFAAGAFASAARTAAAFASSAAADYATDIAASAAARAAVWNTIRTDAHALQSGTDPSTAPLWPAIPPDWFTKADTRTRAIWSRDPATWAFWLRWWDGILAGKPLDWELQRDVALIPDDDWQKGPAHIAGIIADIERSKRFNLAPSDLVAREVAALASAAPQAVKRVRRSIIANHDALPATFDAIEGYIDLEIDRLRGRNDIPDNLVEEFRRQIDVLRILASAIARLRTAIPAKGPATVAEAEEVEKLWRVYGKHFADWPRANAGEIVDSSFRGALIGATVAAGALIGAPMPYALAAGIVLFGGKKIGEAIKIAKDAVK